MESSSLKLTKLLEKTRYIDKNRIVVETIFIFIVVSDYRNHIGIESFSFHSIILLSNLSSVHSIFPAGIASFLSRLIVQNNSIATPVPNITGVMIRNIKLFERTEKISNN